jgi:hypothetical protein
MKPSAVDDLPVRRAPDALQHVGRQRSPLRWLKIGIATRGFPDLLYH